MKVPKKSELPYDPTISLSLYPDKSIIRKDICTIIFIAALFTILKIWRQPNFPSIDESIMKMQFSLSLYICVHTFIHTVGYYSVMKNEIVPFQQCGWT